MTVFTNAIGTRKPIRTKVTSSTAVTLYTANKTKAFLEAVNVCNLDASADTFNLYVNDGTSDFYIANDEAIAANTRVKISDLPIDIPEGGTLKFKAGTGTAIDVVGTIIEQAPQNRP